MLEQEATLCKYWEFSKEMEKILQENGEIRLPININSIAQKLGFDIIVMDEISDRCYGYLSQKEILVSSKLSYKEKRWTIAKSIALQYWGKSGMIPITNPFFVACDINAFTADSFTILILLPVSLFKKELSEYKSKVQEFDGNKYLEHLCNCSQIPMFHLSMGYHIINQMLCFQRQKAFEKVGYDITKFQKDEFENIYF